MTNSIISEGKTTAEAVEKGLKELKVSKEKVNIKVIEEEKRSFYNILAPRVVKVELTLKDESEVQEKSKIKHSIETDKRKDEKPKANENLEEIEIAVTDIKAFLDKFLSDNIKYKIRIENFEVLIEIAGENVNYLIGYRGETINSLQTVLSAIANKKSSAKIRVFLDIAGYREKRVKTLEDLAEKIAKTVIRTGKAISLEPMSAYERKIIHTKLQQNSKITTFSKGEEPYRKIVVALKQ